MSGTVLGTSRVLTWSLRDLSWVPRFILRRQSPPAGERQEPAHHTASRREVSPPTAVPHALPAALGRACEFHHLRKVGKLCATPSLVEILRCVSTPN